MRQLLTALALALLVWAPADFPVMAYYVSVCMASPCSAVENHQLYGTTPDWEGTVFVTAVRPDGSEEPWTGLLWVGED